ncbi:putative transposase YbfD/YdcC [Porphyromonas circumdentaria]|nr:putative transposase YbfD/YdcC [Porphyromonas circumdentaria]
MIDLEGNVVTIDAIGTQKEIVNKIVDSSGDYILNVKGNQ